MRKGSTSTLLCALALLGTASFPLRAQPPTGKRAISKTEIARHKWPRLQRLNHGDYHSHFAALQFLLRNRGFYRGTPDGRFDSQRTRPTENAVKAFQRAHKLKVDGIVGPQTWEKLLVRVKRGDRGDAVRALQTLLAKFSTLDASSEASLHPYKVKVDGIFGVETENALRRYQRERELKADGIAGPHTWWWLFAGDDCC